MENRSFGREFGLYVHIPYCLQICTYCDFVKFESRELPPHEEYISLLIRELKSRSKAFGSRELSSIYFGGGTPSLFAPKEILSILNGIANEGFFLASNNETAKEKVNGSASSTPDGNAAEITLEINPGTLTDESIDEFLKIGITRFSVGAQTFDRDLLKVTGRKHTVDDTISTLRLLSKRNLNYSFDLLFGLPGQTLNGVRDDVAKALEFSPSHLSAYNLTVPEKHPLNRGRAPDDEQAEMFEAIESDLARAGIFRYEVSNFSKPGFESRHNLLYWSDRPYWGLGIGAHSYVPRGDHTLDHEDESWGVRFWNPSTIAAYRNELAAIEQSESPKFWRQIRPERLEKLQKHEALTDFAHTALRAKHGLSKTALRDKFGPEIFSQISSRLMEQQLVPLIVDNGDSWSLSAKGQAMADRVFETLTFLEV